MRGLRLEEASRFIGSRMNHLSNDVNVTCQTARLWLLSEDPSAIQSIVCKKHRKIAFPNSLMHHPLDSIQLIKLFNKNLESLSNLLNRNISFGDQVADNLSLISQDNDFWTKFENSIEFVLKLEKFSMKTLLMTLP